MVLRLPDSWSNWNLEMLVIEEKGETGANERTNNKLTPHIDVNARSHHCATLDPPFLFATT